MPSNPFADGINVEVGSDVSGFESGMSGAIQKLGSFRTQIGLAAGAIATLSAVGIAKSVSAFGDFDAAMTESTAIMGDMDDQMRTTMSETAREVAKTTTFSATEAAESYFYLASAGLDAEESVAALRPAAQFAQAGMFNMATATDILTDAQSALGDESLTMVNLSDKLVKANTMANASVEQFGEALTNKAAPAMSRMGVTTNDGIAALAVFADAGLKGRRAGTILARTLTGLEKNSRKNADTFKELGISVTNAQGEMRPLKAITEDLEDALGEMSTAQRQAALEQLGFNKRTMQGVDLLMGNSEALGKYNEGLETSAGITEDVAQNQLKTMNAQFGLLQSRITNAAIGIGEKFAPTIITLTKHLMTLIDRLSAINQSFGGMLAPILLVVGVIGGLIIAVGALLPVLAGAAAGIGTVVGALATLALPITIAIGLIALLALAWTKNWGNIQGITADAIAFIRNLIQAFVARVRQFWAAHGEQIISTITSAYNRVKAFIQAALSFIQENLIQPTLKRIMALWQIHGQALFAEIQATWQAVQGYIKQVLDFIIPIVRTALAFISALWSKHGDTIMMLVSTAFTIISTVIVNAMDLVLTTIRVMMALIRGDWRQAWTLIADFAGRLWDRIGTIIKAAGAAILVIIGGLIDGIIGFFQDLYQRLVGGSIIPEMFASIISSLVTFVANFIADVNQFIINVITAFTTFVADVVSMYIQFWADIITSLTGFVTDFLSGVTSMITDVTTKIATFISNLITAYLNLWIDILTGLANFVTDAMTKWNDFKATLITVTTEIRDRLTTLVGELADNIIEFFSGLISDALNWGSDIINNVASGIRSRASALASAFSGVASSAANAFVSTFNSIIPSSVRIPSVSISIPSLLGGGSISVGGGSIQIPQLQSGGLITSGGLAELHAGERVVPAAEVDRTAGGKTQQFNVTVYANDRQGGREAGEAFTRALRSKNFN